MKSTDLIKELTEAGCDSKGITEEATRYGGHR